MDTGKKQHIFLVPGTPVLCALNSSNKLYEVLHHVDELSSWFYEESVIKDGSLFFLTPADPLFFVLPYINQDGKFCPLEDLLIDENYPDIHNLTKCCDSEELLNIFDSKNAAGYKVYCYNKDKTLQWLQTKVKYLAMSLENKNIHINDGSKAASLQVDDEEVDPKVLMEYSCHMVSEYLSDEVSKDLFLSLGFEQVQKKCQQKNQVIQNKSKDEHLNPVENCSKKLDSSILQDKKKSKLSTAQKQLLKVDKTGMKNISSFFLKK
ncbi:ribonuclease H2 subunit B-like isoform X2 [Stegodyphus dumicola]|uniref:ribonuclease H2 subunit B-like isoform X2 n=1 Tax=Stegodyphus dumicola TaxID=202533 RepID=UPI0015B0E481|nr:ribonuclease H2 subunit B-like isoform X2 [Stegodyphus dumicola]